MSNGKSVKKTTEAALATKLVAGIGKRFANASPLSFGSETITPAELTKRLQTLVDLRKGVEDAKATTKAKLAAEDAQAPALLSLMAEFVSFVKVTFSKSPDVLAEFGLAPKKARTPLSVEKMATAVAKRKATRAERHTMGKRQKKGVTGNVVDVVVTPVTTPKPVAPSPVASAPAQGATGSTPHGA